MKKIFITLFILITSAPVFAFSEAVPSIIPQAGTLNNQNLDSLRQQQMEKQIQEDYKKFEERKENGEAQKDEIEKKSHPVIRAKLEDYATKGVYIEKIEVSPSHILTTQEIEDILKDYNNQNLTIDQLKEIVNRINKLYLSYGFVTARAFLPEQIIEGGIVKIKLVEGRVEDIVVLDNKWTTSKYIKDRLNVSKGDIFNVQNLERSMVVFNRYNNGVQLTGELSPGKNQMGTTDITVKAHEKFPFHLTAMMDNSGRKSVGEYRGGLMLRDDSLTKHRDPLTLGFYANKNSITPFADYNFPVNKKDGRIGFSFSSSNSKIGNGAYKIFNIKSRSQNYSLYFTQPIIRKPWTELTSVTSLAYKHSATSFDGKDIFEDKVTTVTTGLTYRYDTQKGIWYLNQNVGYSIPIFDKNSNYLKLDGGVLRLHDLGHGFVGTIRGNYQFIPKDNVPYLDQMIAGGGTTVRGYSEGLLIGRSGYIMSAELMFPLGPRVIYTKKDPNNPKPFIGNYLKGFVFADHAGIFPYKGSGTGSKSYDKNDFLASLGFGIKINLPAGLNLRLAWGFPLMKNSYEETSRAGRFHIDLSMTLDSDTLVSLRRPKIKQENKEPETKIEPIVEKNVNAQLYETKTKEEIKAEKQEEKLKAKEEKEKLKQERIRAKKEKKLLELLYGKDNPTKLDLFIDKIKHSRKKNNFSTRKNKKTKLYETKTKEEIKAEKLKAKEEKQLYELLHGKNKSSKIDSFKKKINQLFKKNEPSIKNNKTKEEIKAEKLKNKEAKAKAKQEKIKAKKEKQLYKLLHGKNNSSKFEI